MFAGRNIVLGPAGGLAMALAAAMLLTACRPDTTGSRPAANAGGTKANSTSALGAQPATWTFDTDAAGGLPAGATVFSGTWAVRAEPDAPSQPNAVCQTGTAEFPAMSLSDGAFGDTMLSARVKPISGRTDQAAGLIFRIQDKNNYYILRANALENNVNLYKYAGGRRSGIKEASATVTKGTWQDLRAEAVGNHLRGFLNGKLVVEATDDSYKSGGVGLWTKADSVTCFDDVEVGLP